MVIKINYNHVITFFSLFIIVGLILVEFSLPPTSKTDANIENSNIEIKLPVAMYHHMLNAPSKLGDYVISPTQFEEDLKYIKKMGYTTINSKELLDFIENGTELPPKPIMITFDDGNESVYEYAYPLLKKYDMKAIVSIIGKQTDFFSDENHQKHINYSYLSWDELRELEESGIFEIQNHSYDMHETPNSRRFGIRTKKNESKEEYKKALINDIGGLNKQITQEIGVTPTVFALPFGVKSKQTEKILEEMGFKIILTCEEKINTINFQQELPIKLKRFNRANKYSTYDFYSKLLKK